MRRILITTWFLGAFLSVSLVSFSQQGGQPDSTKRSNPANTGMQNQQGQKTQNNPVDQGSQSGQGSQNNDFLLQQEGSYPVDQNLEINKKNLINPLTNSPVYPEGQNNQSNSGIQGPVTPGVQNQGDPSQSLPAGQGSQSVPGNTGKGVSNQVNPGINNNPGIPNDKGTQNRDSIQKDKGNKAPVGKKPGDSAQ